MRKTERISKILSEKKLKIAVAESCTGGFISNAFTNIPGASKFFTLGVVTYSNEAKQKILGIDENTLKQYGAVSEEVASLMARNVKRIACADIGLSTTGYLAPAKDVPEHMVGIIYAGIDFKHTLIYTAKLTGNRVQMKAQACSFVLQKLQENIEEFFTLGGG
jgi:nicotinamide-nucleotide amidase